MKYFIPHKPTTTPKVTLTATLWAKHPHKMRGGRPNTYTPLYRAHLHTLSRGPVGRGRLV